MQNTVFEITYNLYSELFESMNGYRPNNMSTFKSLQALQAEIEALYKAIKEQNDMIDAYEADQYLYAEMIDSQFGSF